MYERSERKSVSCICFYNMAFYSICAARLRYILRITIVFIVFTSGGSNQHCRFATIVEREGEDRERGRCKEEKKKREEGARQGMGE